MADEKRILYLQQKLTAFATHLERLENYLNGENVDSINAQMRLQNLKMMYESSLKYIDELTSIEPNNPKIKTFIEVEGRYFEAASTVTRLQQVEPLMSSTLNPNNITITERQDLPKLPEIKIPKFDGNREHWANFKNKFDVLVRDRTDISDAVKCTLLFDSVIDKAHAKINQFEPSAKDYHKAWNTLLDYYDHKRIVAVEHLNAILDLPQLTKESPDELSSLLDKARQHLHILDGLEARSGDDFVVRIIERCLPPQTRRKWQDKLDMDELPKLDALTRFIQTTIFKHQAGEYSNTTGRNLKKRPGENLPQSTNKTAKTTSYAFSTSASSKSSSSHSSSPACLKCGDTHHLFKCPEFNGLSVQERWTFIKNTKACKNCLWIHQFPCKSEKRCKKCSRDHHTLLHNDKRSQLVRTPDVPSSTSGNVPQ